MSKSTFSLLGILGAFIFLVGLGMGCSGSVNGNSLIGYLGVFVMLIGAGLGAKYK